jgi:hypothetical protein
LANLTDAGQARSTGGGARPTWDHLSWFDHWTYYTAGVDRLEYELSPPDELTDRVVDAGMRIDAEISGGGGAESAVVVGALVGIKALQRQLRSRAARVLPELKLFEKLGIKVDDHFRKRLAQRVSRGITESNSLDAYLNGRLYYNRATRNYVRHSSRTGVSVAVDAPTGGRAITVFEGNPSPDWVPVPWRPGL